MFAYLFFSLDIISSIPNVYVAAVCNSTLEIAIFGRHFDNLDIFNILLSEQQS